MTEDGQRQLELRQYRWTDSLRNCLKKRYMRLVLAEIISAGGFYDDIASRDSQQTERAVGRRAIALWRRREIAKVDPNAPMLLEQELREEIPDPKNRDAEEGEDEER